MSHLTYHGSENTTECSLTKALEDVSQQGHAQAVALQEKQQELRALQAILSGVERQAEEAAQDLRGKALQVSTLEGELDCLRRHLQVVRANRAALCDQNAGLRLRAAELEEECTCVALATYHAYRAKMEGHRSAVAHARSRTKAHKDLEEKRELVGKLRQRREELRMDLENPEGLAIQEAKRDIEELKAKIAVQRKNVAEKREKLLKEFGTHTEIKKDIQIQNKRYEAIIKRLSFQLNKAQAVKRQMSGEIFHMERQIVDLRKQLDVV